MSSTIRVCESEVMHEDLEKETNCNPFSLKNKEKLFEKNITPSPKKTFKEDAGVNLVDFEFSSSTNSTTPKGTTFSLKDKQEVFVKGPGILKQIDKTYKESKILIFYIYSHQKKHNRIQTNKRR